MNTTDSIRTNTPGCREGETMNITTTRRGKESCSTCHHATICRLKEQRAKVEKELADMASLMENKNFDTVAAIWNMMYEAMKEEKELPVTALFNLL